MSTKKQDLRVNNGGKGKVGRKKLSENDKKKGITFWLFGHELKKFAETEDLKDAIIITKSKVYELIRK